MPRCAATVQGELAELDQFSVFDIPVGLGRTVLGDHALAVWKMTLQKTGSGHVIGVHVRID